VPTFPTHRLTGAVPSFSPAASPHLRRRLSVWPPCQPHFAGVGVALRSPHACVHCCPAHIHQVGAGSGLTGVDHWFSSAYTFPSCLPDPGRLAVPTRPVVVGAAPTLPGASRIRLPPASTACCDRPQAESFHLRPDTWNLVAHRRLPVVAGGFHRDQRHPVAAQPGGQVQQRPGGRGVLPDFLAAVSRLCRVRDSYT